jgi:Zn-dependent peptidase ImmA (M78 family)
MVKVHTVNTLRRRVWSLRQRAGGTGAVLTDGQLEGIARMLGASVVASPSMTDMYGCLSTTTRGLVIRVNPTLQAAERRYTIGHEIGHILVDPAIPAVRNELAYGMAHPQHSEAAEREQLCDWISAELLIPHAALAAEMDLRGDECGIVGRISEEYQVPEQAVLMQMRYSGYDQMRQQLNYLTHRANSKAAGRKQRND